MSPLWQQAITWTKDDPIHWRIHTSANINSSTHKSVDGSVASGEGHGKSIHPNVEKIPRGKHAANHKFKNSFPLNKQTSLFSYQYLWFTLHMNIYLLTIHFNSLRRSEAYMCQQTRPSLLQIMACCLYGANVWILIKMSLKFVSKGQINNIPALVQIMAWRWPGDKPLSEPMMVRLLTHKCVTQPQLEKLERPRSEIPPAA